MWLLWIIPVLLFAVSLSDFREFDEVGIYVMLIMIHCAHVGIRHGTTPNSDYTCYYNQVIDKEILTESFVLSGGMNLNPKTVDREIDRAISHQGC